MCEFLSWLSTQTFFRRGSNSAPAVCSVRDITTWIKFINKSTINDHDTESIALMERIDQDYDPLVALIHGACLVFIDQLLPSSGDQAESPRDTCLNFLINSIQFKLKGDANMIGE